MASPVILPASFEFAKSLLPNPLRRSTHLSIRRASTPNNTDVASVKVICRFKPSNGETEAVKVTNDTSCCVETRGAMDETSTYSFDRIFAPNCSQEVVYKSSGVSKLLADVTNGVNGTIFAYGQTASGKTHTMMGPTCEDVTTEQRGIIPRAVQELFELIQSIRQPNESFTVGVSYLEIYMEAVRDLLEPVNDNLPVHEDADRGVYVKGLKEVLVTSTRDALNLYKRGNRDRMTHATGMNERSSRSHAIFSISVTCTDAVTLRQRNGVLYLVDLAGSEKVFKTGAQGQTLEEAKQINKSLHALGKVIHALTSPISSASPTKDRAATPSHIPYRDSKLTRILQQSLGGNSQTILMLCAANTREELSETISTLRFGVRAKFIRNQITVNSVLLTTTKEEKYRLLLIEAQQEIQNMKLNNRSLQEQLELSKLEPFLANHLENPNSLDDKETMTEENMNTESALQSRLKIIEAEKSRLQEAMNALQQKWQEEHQEISYEMQEATERAALAEANLSSNKGRIADVVSRMKDKLSLVEESTMKMDELESRLQQADRMKAEIQKRSKVVLQWTSLAMRSRLRAIQTRNFSLFDSLQRSKAEQGDLITEIHTLREVIKTHEHLVAAQEETCLNMSYELENTKEEAKTVRWAMEALDETNRQISADARAAVQKRFETYTAAKFRVRFLKSRVDSTQKALENVEREYLLSATHSETQAESHARDVKQRVAEVEDFKGMLVSASAAAEATQRQLGNLEKVITSHEGLSQKLQSEKDELRADNTAIYEEKLMLESEVKRLRKEMGGMKEKLIGLEVMEKEIDELKRSELITKEENLVRIETLEQANRELGSGVEIRDQRVNELQERISEMKQALEDVNHAYEKTKEMIQRLEEQITVLEKQNQTTKDELEQSKAELAASVSKAVVAPRVIAPSIQSRLNAIEGTYGLIPLINQLGQKEMDVRLTRAASVRMAPPSHRNSTDSIPNILQRLSSITSENGRSGFISTVLLNEEVQGDHVYIKEEKTKSASKAEPSYEHSVQQQPQSA